MKEPSSTKTVDIQPEVIILPKRSFSGTWTYSARIFRESFWWIFNPEMLRVEGVS